MTFVNKEDLDRTQKLSLDTNKSLLVSHDDRTWRGSFLKLHLTIVLLSLIYISQASCTLCRVVISKPSGPARLLLPSNPGYTITTTTIAEASFFADSLQEKMGFGDFTTICQQTSFPLCPLLGPQPAANGGTGILATCYARSIELANTIIFEAAADFVHIIALIMTAVMIIHVRSKFTAVGRKEITLFFYLYMGLTVTSLILDAGVITAGMGVYPYIVALQNGLTSALCTCLMINGFVGFQLYEDGTSQSVWTLRGCSLVMFLITGMVSIFTFQSLAGLSPTNTAGLFVVLYVLNALCLLVYVIMQLMLVVNTLQDRWPLGDILFGILFFVAGQIAVYVLGAITCTGTNHYLDSLFFATIGNLLAVMMVYKYWDSITMEDLEFSVGMKQGQWEVKDPLLGEDSRTTIYRDSTTDYSSPVRRAPPYTQHRQSAYGGSY